MYLKRQLPCTENIQQYNNNKMLFNTICMFICRMQGALLGMQLAYHRVVSLVHNELLVPHLMAPCQFGMLKEVIGRYIIYMLMLSILLLVAMMMSEYSCSISDTFVHSLNCNVYSLYLRWYLCYRCRLVIDMSLHCFAILLICSDQIQNSYAKVQACVRR